MPGKRPRTTLSPSLAMAKGEPYLAFGTPGGDQQDQWTLQFFLNVVDFGMDLQAAIEAPKFSTPHFPSTFYPHDNRPGVLRIEDRVPASVRDALAAARPQDRSASAVVRGPRTGRADQHEDRHDLRRRRSARPGRASDARASDRLVMRKLAVVLAAVPHVEGRASLSAAGVIPAPTRAARRRERGRHPAGTKFLNTGQPLALLLRRREKMRCAVFASSHWVQGSPLPPTAQVILPWTDYGGECRDGCGNCGR